MDHENHHTLSTFFSSHWPRDSPPHGRREPQLSEPRGGGREAGEGSREQRGAPIL